MIYFLKNMDNKKNGKKRQNRYDKYTNCIT